MGFMEQRVVMEGILYNEQNEALLVQRSDHESFPEKWELPSGKVEIGEDPVEALEREFEEEVNLEVEYGQPLNVRDYTTSDRHNVLIACTVESVDGNYDRVQLSDEHQDYDWVGENELDDYDIIEPVQGDLEEAWERFH